MAEQQKKADDKKSAFEIAGMTDAKNVQLGKSATDKNLEVVNLA
jgi:hypothetical protein